MALNGIKPKKVKKRLKALFYGNAGVGKTTAAIQFPCPYLIDTEKGSVNDAYVDVLDKNNASIFFSSDADKIIEEIKSLLTEKHEFKTLIIDPLTCVYNNLLEEYSENGTDFGKHYVEANKKIKHLLNLIIRLDMNVIITSHSKNEYGINMSLIGQTFDCYKKLDYMFDLVFEIQKKGNDRICIVKKSRIDQFEDSSSFKFSYSEILKRYGKDLLEKEVISEKLAEESQIKEIIKLTQILKIPDISIHKWLSKEKAETLEELNFDFASNLINHLRTKIDKELNIK